MFGLTWIAALHSTVEGFYKNKKIFNKKKFHINKFLAYISPVPKNCTLIVCPDISKMRAGHAGYPGTVPSTISLITYSLSGASSNIFSFKLNFVVLFRGFSFFVDSILFACDAEATFWLFDALLLCVPSSSSVQLVSFLSVCCRFRFVARFDSSAVFVSSSLQRALHR